MSNNQVYGLGVEGELWFAFADFYGENSSTLTDYKLPNQHDIAAERDV